MIKKTDRQAEKDEIFLYTGSGIPKNIDAESILWKCSVYDFKLRKSSDLQFCENNRIDNAIWNPNKISYQTKNEKATKTFQQRAYIFLSCIF